MTDNEYVLLDGRDMQPPEPFEKTLEALDGLPRGKVLRVLLWHQPKPLYQFLDRNGYRHEADVEDDGTVAVRIWMPAA